MKIGIWGGAYSPSAIDFVVEAEKLGAHTVWLPEFWAGDALTPIAFLAGRTTKIRLASAIVQLGTRTPALLAMSAQSLQALSHDRFILGLGTSGPQVMEGWHGVAFDKPITRTRETIEIVRMITRGEKLNYKGDLYELPLPGGEGRSIRSAMPPVHVPIYLASLGPANLELTGEQADGWIGNSFMPESAEVFIEPIRQGATKAGRDLSEIDLTVSVSVEFTDDVEEAAQRHAAGYAFTFGAMGSPTTNFYNNAFARQGWGEDIQAVQKLWLAGDREAARERVPNEIGFKTNLIGTPELILDRLRLYAAAGINELRVQLTSDGLDKQLHDLEQLIGLTQQVNDEGMTKPSVNVH
ncbi:MAG: LLM class flavin-dependent oxidoreductase [Acidimicrobiia bacterium]